MNFTTSTTDCDYIDFNFHGTKGFLKKEFDFEVFQIDWITAYAKIDWEFYIEARSYGIKDFGAYVTKVVMELTIDLYKDEKSEDSEELEFDITDKIKDFEIKTETTQSDQFIISDVDIDFYSKEITITFN